MTRRNILRTFTSHPAIECGLAINFLRWPVHIIGARGR